MAGSRTISVEIVGDADSLTKAFSKAGDASSSFGKSLGKAAKYAGLAIGAAGIGGLAVVLKTGIAEFSEASKVTAQTGAVLKSTGMAAKVTGEQVAGLAESLMRKSGVDDEAIQSGENMLLTFTKIRNETGKGNDIFNQATKATLDLSVAMGKDMSSSAILVGKALNDPVKGMTALSKAGIQFTAAQKETIKGMVATGNVMGAQKLILGELTTQFGGSAEALGKTLPGQLNILKESFSNVSGEIVAGLVPAFSKVMEGTAAFVQRLGEADGASAKLGVVVDQVKSIAVAAWNGIRAAFNGINWGEVWNTVRDAFVKAVGFLTALPWGQWLSAVASSAWNALRGAFNAINWSAVGETVGDALVTALGKLTSFINRVNWNAVGQALVQGLGVAIKALAQWLIGLDYPAILAALVKGIIAVLKGLAGLLLGIATAAGAAIVKGLQAGALSAWGGLKSWLSSIPGMAREAIGDLSAALWSAGRDLILGFIQGVRNAAGELAGAAIDAARGAVDGVKSFLHIKSPSQVFAGIGHDTIAGFILGINEKAPELSGKMAETIGKALEAAKAKVESYQTVLGDAFGKLGDFISKAFDKKTQNILDNVSKKFDAQIAKWNLLADALTPAEKALAELDRTEEAKGRRDAMSAAQAALDQANHIEDAVEREKAKAAALEQIRLADLANVRFDLQQKATEERAAQEKAAAAQIEKLEATKARELANLTERREQAKTKLDEQIADLTERLSKHPEEYDKINKKIQALLKAQGIPMKASGKLLGDAFADGIRASFKNVGSAAKKLAQIVADYVPHSPAKKGPLSVLPGWSDYLTAGFPKSLNVAASAARAASATTGGMPMRAPVAAGAYAGGGAAVYNFTFPHYVGDRRELATAVRTEFDRINRRN